jgi:hypothetical protein
METMATRSSNATSVAFDDRVAIVSIIISNMISLTCPRVDIEALRAKLGEVNKHANEAGDILTKLLEGHMKPHNVAKIKETINFLTNPEFLLRVRLFCGRRKTDDFRCSRMKPWMMIFRN